MNAAVPYTPVRVAVESPTQRAKFPHRWVPYPEGQAVLREMARLIARPNEGRPANLALLADSGFGKSHLIDYFADCYPDIDNPPETCIQVLSLEVPPEADGTKVLRAILHGLSVEFSPRLPSDELLRRAVVHLKSMRVRLLILDEVHNAIGGRRDHALSMVQTLRGLSNGYQRPMVIVGTSRVEEVLRYDEQLNERFSKWRLPVWSNPQALRPFLSAFETTLPVKGNLGSTAAAQLIIELTEGRMGRIAALLRDAANEAVLKGHTDLSPELLRACATRLPGRKP